MIPIPPPDAAIPALPDLLNGDAIGEIVGRHIEIPVIECRPRYVRYKPGTSCLTMYDLVTPDRSGEPVVTPMSLKVFGDDRGRRRSASVKMGRLIDRVVRSGNSPSFDPVHYMPELDALMQVFPIDYDLRYLARAADQQEMTRVLRKEHPDLAEASVSELPELIRYKPARKALLLYRLGNAPVGAVYAKLRSAEANAQLLARQTEQLSAAGVLTPPVRVVIPKGNLVAHDAVRGNQLAGLRGTSEFVDWMDPLADALIRLQRTEIPAPAHTNRDEAEAVIAVGKALSSLLPQDQEQIHALTGEIARRLEAIGDQAATVHGDFYDDQALVSGESVTIIDLDEMCIGHPLRDAGNMLAHLASGAARGDGSSEAREAFAEAVGRRWRYPEADLAVFEAAALVKLAPGPFRRLESDWPEQVFRILDLAGSCLRDGAETSHVAGGSAGQWGPLTDQKLPQLDALQDPSAVSTALASALDDVSVRVRDIEVVRHKRGRRAILRYRVERGGQAEILYGKTFASKRGPKVYEVTNAITKRRAFGPEIDLPEPVAYLPELRTIVQREVPGHSIERSLLGDDVGLVGRLALALHRYHHSDVELGRSHSLSKELEPLPMRVAQVAGVCADIGARAEAVLKRIEHVDDTTVFEWRSLPVHRDFYHDQVLIDGDRLAILDLDDASMSEPAVDVANFAAHLMLLGLQAGRAASLLQHQTDAFINRYQALGDSCDPVVLRFLTATTLVRIAGIHVTRERGIAVAGGLIDTADSLLP